MPTTPAPYQKILDTWGTGALAEKLGITITYASPELITATMPVAGNTQPVGLLHGGASAALAETLGSLAAFLSATEHGKVAVGVDLNITHLRPATSGLVTGTCRAVKLGHTTTVHTIDITDENHKIIASARITNQLITHPTPPQAQV